MSFNSWLQISVLAVLVVGPIGHQALAKTKKVSEVPVRAIASVNGADVYAQYCAVCHGKDGQGNGPAAVALKPAPRDLTRIAQKNGGKFPTLAVQQSITNSDSTVAHGTAGMPVWGELLAPTPNNTSLAELQIRNLTRYIEGLQK